MTRKKWFRIYHGLATDMSLAVAAQNAGIGRCEMLALWLCLLDTASRATPAGSIKDFALEETALLLGLPCDKIAKALESLHQKKKIDAQSRIVGWEKTQPSSTSRVNRLRQQRRQHVPPAPSAMPPPTKAVDHDSPAAIAARRARLQQNNTLIIGQPARNT